MLNMLQRAATMQAAAAERRRRSEARLDARLEVHSEVAAPSSASRALWSEGASSAACSPQRRRATDGQPPQPAATDEPTPPRAVPPAALWAQPPAPMARGSLPQGPFAFGGGSLQQPATKTQHAEAGATMTQQARPSVRRYSSPAASPHQWRPARVPEADQQQEHDAAGEQGGAGVRPRVPPPMWRDAEVQASAPKADRAPPADGGDGSDWEDAGRWLEPAAPGAHHRPAD